MIFGNDPTKQVQLREDLQNFMQIVLKLTVGEVCPVEVGRKIVPVVCTGEVVQVRFMEELPTVNVVVVTNNRKESECTS